MPTSRSYPKHLIEFGERKKKVIYLPLFPVFLKKMQLFKKDVTISINIFFLYLKKMQLFSLTSISFESARVFACVIGMA